MSPIKYFLNVIFGKFLTYRSTNKLETQFFLYSVNIMSRYLYLATRYQSINKLLWIPVSVSFENFGYSHKCWIWMFFPVGFTDFACSTSILLVGLDNIIDLTYINTKLFAYFNFISFTSLSKVTQFYYLPY